MPPPSKIDWVKIRERMPMDKNDPAAKKKRQDLFKAFDPNGNGYLSLAEVDKGVRDVLGLHEIFDLKPVLMRAFQAAKGVAKTKSKLGDDYVEFPEFRILLVYLRQYLELWQMFDEVDTSDDRRVSKDEFRKAVPLLETWGVKVTNPDATFKVIDKDGGGMLLFDEFADWAIKNNLDLPDDDE